MTALLKKPQTELKDFNSLPYHEKRLLSGIEDFLQRNNIGNYVGLLNRMFENHMNHALEDYGTDAIKRDIKTFGDITEFLSRISEDFKDHNEIDLKKNSIEIDPMFVHQSA